MIVYIENEPVPAVKIATLRKRVGWNGMEDAYNHPRMTSYYHIACYNADKLIGYVDSVSNGVTLGRPKVELPSDFLKQYKKYSNDDYGKISASNFAKILGNGRSTFYIYVNVYEQNA